MQTTLNPCSLPLRVGQVRAPQSFGAVAVFLPHSILQWQPVCYSGRSRRRSELGCGGGGCDCMQTLCVRARRIPAPPAGHLHAHLQPVRLRTRRGSCGLPRCRPLPTAAGRLVAHSTACKAAAVVAPLAWLARRLWLHAARGDPEAPQVARGPCRHPLLSPSSSRVPVMHGVWGSCVCRMSLASLHCRASSCLPAPSQVRPARPAAPVGSHPGRARLRVVVRLSRGCCSRPAGQQQPSASGVGCWRWRQCFWGPTPVHQKDGWVLQVASCH